MISGEVASCVNQPRPFGRANRRLFETTGESQSKPSIELVYPEPGTELKGRISAPIYGKEILPSPITRVFDCGSGVETSKELAQPLPPFPTAPRPAPGAPRDVERRRRRPSQPRRPPAADFEPLDV